MRIAQQLSFKPGIIFFVFQEEPNGAIVPRAPQFFGEESKCQDHH